MLEKTSKIMKSNRKFNTTMPAKPCPYMFYEHLQWWWLHHFRGQPVPMPDHAFSKEIFHNIQPSKPPLMQFGAIKAAV